MTSTGCLFLLFLILRTLGSTHGHGHGHAHPQAQPQLTLTIFNNCPFSIWPAIRPNAAALPVLQRGGFALPSLSHRSFPAPSTPWSGRIWARTGCVTSGGHLSCATGECSGRLECNGLAGGRPATLAQLDLSAAGYSSYGVSLANGFNLPVTITPHEGKGECPVVGCWGDLLATCPPSLQVRSPAPRVAVVGCKSSCAAPREIKVIFCHILNN